ncbi:PBP1A family penicillin-binding protein [Aneurinibacillus sp. Ricciae_BoGa-3]|uniref:transglycosylase domain-containing protein n=1 Tax=Aneurinibacillus sp. Ricciae_BoGa-3 TaxID=3022697 RepID=UPI00234007C1|nr:PBP1A family penicillin-binding protein [Aneurinibacillus sp. Ricciae_BoGa-3]WCK55694.1 PBP1A family penicillin-binding protein [Aneurinibacillus sp. Ricciae_BoGa-3]
MEKNTPSKSGTTTRKRRKKGPWKIIFLFVGLFIVLSIGGCSAMYVAGNSMIDEKKLDLMQASTVYSIDGKEIAKLATQNRVKVSYDKIPKQVINAFVATEDSRFYEHNGVDPLSIGRAIVKDITTGSKAEGASTITQQLARNVFLTNDKTYMRKTKEIMIALNLERKYSKQQILEMYLNEIYLGPGIYGIETASEYYFGKPIDKVSLAEAASLAALPKAPNTYAPKVGETNANQQRRNIVLGLMQKQGYITADEMAAAQREPVDVVKPTQDKNDPAYTAYLDYIGQEAANKLGINESDLYKGGYKIYTYLDPTMQHAMYNEYQNPDNFPAGQPDQKVQSSMVIMDSKTGGITALVGGRDYVTKGLNRATTLRQPGSSIKPLVDYAPALEEGWTPDSTVYDVKKTYKAYNNYTPKNFRDEGYAGPISMYRALVDSRNAAAVWTLDKIGLDKGVSYLKKFGIPVQPNEGNNLALAVGGMQYGASAIQMAQAYSAFPNNGNMSTGHVIKQITTQDGTVIAQGDKAPTPVVSPQTAYYMTQMLQGVVHEGTGQAAYFGRPLAGKTGTHQDQFVWFVGYTPDYVAAVWMGYDKPDANHYLTTTGGAYPARLFNKVMSQSLADKPVTDFQQPAGMDTAPAPQQPQQQNTAPAASGLSAVSDGSTVSLSWSGSGSGSNVTYRIYKFAGSIANKQLVGETGGTSYSDSFDPNQAYSYVVVPVDKTTGQEGTMSNIATVTMSKGPQGNQPNQQNPGNNGNANGGQQNGNQGQNSGNPYNNGQNPGNQTPGSQNPNPNDQQQNGQNPNPSGQNPNGGGSNGPDQNSGGADQSGGTAGGQNGGVNTQGTPAVTNGRHHRGAQQNGIIPQTGQ